MQIGAVVFSNEYGLLGKTEQADELLLKITADVTVKNKDSAWQIGTRNKYMVKLSERGREQKT